MTRSGFPLVDRLVDSDLAHQAKAMFENETRNRKAKVQFDEYDSPARVRAEQDRLKREFYEREQRRA